MFDKKGYVPLKEYIDDITDMRKNGPWKLPLGMSDRFHLFFLNLVARFSWFSDALHISHLSDISPSYSILLSYLKKKRFFDSLTERDMHFPGYFSYYLEKEVTVNNLPWIIRGQGVSEDKATAFSIALGETIERAVSGLYDENKEILIASPEEIQKEFPILYPPRFHRFLDIQKKRYEELRHDPKQSMEWVRGMNLVTREKTYIPRHMTSWFTENRKGKKTLINATTNGAAGYFTRSGAVLRGILEAVQRDAFLVHWLTMIPPSIIRQETLPDGIRKIIDGFTSSGITVYILDCTSLSIPSICVTAINEQSDVPQVVVCAASALTFEEAVENALKEMLIGSEIYYYMDENKEMETALEPEPFVSGFGKVARQLYWRGTEKVELFKWFLSGKSVSFDDISQGDHQCGPSDAERLRKCLEILKNLGGDYYPLAYFPKNEIQEKLGFYVAQVYIPKAFPFYLFEAYGTFDSDRLKEFALTKNIQNWCLNPSPHMFS